MYIVLILLIYYIPYKVLRLVKIVKQIACCFVAVFFGACTTGYINPPETEGTDSTASNDSYYFVKYVYEPEYWNTVSTKIEYTDESGKFIEGHGGRFSKSFLAGPVKKGYTAKIRFSCPYQYIHIACSIEISENGGPYIRRASTSGTSKGSTFYTIR